MSRFFPELPDSHRDVDHGPPRSSEHVTSVLQSHDSPEALDNCRAMSERHTMTMAIGRMLSDKLSV